MPKLNTRQAKFAAGVIAHGNLTRAYIEAGYTPRNAEANASRLMDNDKVAAVVADAHAKLLTDAEVTAERVLRELAIIAFSDLRDVAEWDAEVLRLIPSLELTEDAARTLREVVSTVSETEHGTTRRLHVKQHDKLAALRMLGQYLALFKDKLEVEHKGLGDLFDEITRRAKAA